MRIYLDNRCFNRPYDDQKQLKIHLESQGVEELLRMILDDSASLIWSYMLDLENGANSENAKRNNIRAWRDESETVVIENETIVQLADHFIQVGIKPRDAIHLACAVSKQCDFFFTTDLGVLKNVISFPSKASSVALPF